MRAQFNRRGELKYDYTGSHVTYYRDGGVSKFCYGCNSWSVVYQNQAICPKCNTEGLREA